MNIGIQKMKVSLENETPLYTFKNILLNECVGKEIELKWNGEIFCQSCDKSIKKTFGDGFCYTCFTTVPEATECTIRPELCRAHLGEGRDPEWEQKNHNQPHIVYLTASDKIKVGVTRVTQIPTRWIDQGAVKAIILAETPNRYLAGVLEVALKEYFSDKTNWRKMLSNEIDEDLNLENEKWEVHSLLPDDLSIYFSENDDITTINYPVIEFPKKIKSISFDTTPHYKGKLFGIKGQYLVFENGDVLNIRKHSGYNIELIID